MRSTKLIVVILCLGLTSLSFALTSFADENFCLIQSGVEFGYCEESLLEGGDEETGEDVTILWCTDGDVRAPNPLKKTKCAGNAMVPY